MEGGWYGLYRWYDAKLIQQDNMSGNNTGRVGSKIFDTLGANQAGVTSGTLLGKYVADLESLEMIRMLCIVHTVFVLIILLRFGTGQFYQYLSG